MEALRSGPKAYCHWTSLCHLNSLQPIIGRDCWDWLSIDHMPAPPAAMKRVQEWPSQDHFGYCAPGCCLIFRNLFYFMELYVTDSISRIWELYSFLSLHQSKVPSLHLTDRSNRKEKQKARQTQCVNCRVLEVSFKLTV